MHRTLGAFSKAVKAIWKTASVKAEAEARADYLLAQFDVRKWASSAVEGHEREFALQAYAVHALQVASPPLDAGKTVTDNYFEWVSERLLKPIKEYEPEIYEWIVTRWRELIVSGVETAASSYEGRQ